MPQNPSAGLLAFLLSLPSLALGASPPAEASVSANPPANPGEAAAPLDSPAESPPLPGQGDAAALSPAEAMEARLRRLSEEIRARAGAVEAGLPDGLPDGRKEGEPWLMAGAWLNGNNRGWANRTWPNRIHGGAVYRPPVWANFRPGWGNFRNGPRFINW
jgi:rSAM-associated Gly-rich repeat protein